VIRTRPDGSVITLADIADINDGFVRKQLTNIYNGRPAVFVKVSRAEAEDVLCCRLKKPLTASWKAMLRHRGLN
jgi:multidrug efflux pump subunit AcrB